MGIEIKGTNEYRGARLANVDLSGIEIREANLTGARMVGVELVDAEIDGYIQRLVLNGIDVMPLVEAELDRMHPVRVLIRSNEPDDLRVAWDELVATWDATIERARALSEEQRQEQVRGEWSIAETLRHLVFAIDAWLGRAVLGEAMPYHPAGMPTTDMEGVVEMGIESAARPSFEEAVEMWRVRAASVAAFLGAATTDDLARVCEPYDGPLWPPVEPETAAVRCIRVVLRETLAHHWYAVRDLAVIESPTPAPSGGR